MLKAAVILSGCGHLDGTEIREAVLSLLVLEQKNIEVQCFSIDQKQEFVIDHISKKIVEEQSRNIMYESARIARGNIIDLNNSEIDELSTKFDMLVIPGGFGVVTNFSSNLSNFIKHKDTINEDIIINSKLKSLIRAFATKKPIAAICIAPAIVVAALKDFTEKKVKVTLGKQENADLIEKLGGRYEACAVDYYVKDEDNKIYSNPAYMYYETNLAECYKGINLMIESLIARV